jgi:vacuolar protein sorting-associated protein 13A/C
LQSCLDALASDSKNALHLLERINISLQLYNSIVPMAPNIVRFKVSGQLPTLQLNMSDSKYKSLMRLIDVCVPKFEDGPSSPPNQIPTSNAGGFQLPPLFPQIQPAYGIVEDTEDTRRGHENPPNAGDRSLGVVSGSEKARRYVTGQAH